MQTTHRRHSRCIQLPAALAIILLFACTFFRPTAAAADPTAGAIPNSDATAPAFTPTSYKTFASWKLACLQLPSNRANRHALPPSDKLPLKTFAQFQETLDAFLALSSRGPLAQTNAWIDWAPSHSQFLDTNKYYFAQPNSPQSIPFQPFAMKLALHPGAEIIFHGDLHGDVHSLIHSLDWLNANHYLDGFQLTRTNLYMLFLGDYTDRGMHGIEVLYTLYRLKLANPNQVFLTRGNHEDLHLAANYGFLAEGRAKYPRAFDAAKIMRSYDFMPVVTYLGADPNYIQCNHGGMEPGYDPGPLLDAPAPGRFQMLGALNRAQFLRQNPSWLAGLALTEKPGIDTSLIDFRPENPNAPATLGFVWSDFSILKTEPQLTYDPRRLGLVYGELATQRLLQIAGTQTAHVRAVFRAHQHSSVLNPIMHRLKASHGLFRHWQDRDEPALAHADDQKLRALLDTAPERPIPTGSVWTFNVSPDTHYGEGCHYNFDTLGILKLADQFENWRLRVINVPIPIQ